jgi:hypothetical protein
MHIMDCKERWWFLLQTFANMDDILNWQNCEHLACLACEMMESREYTLW